MRPRHTYIDRTLLLHMSASTVHVHRLNILSTSVTLHVSRVSALPALWLMLCFCLVVARQLPENGVSGSISPRPYVLQTCVSPVVRKRELVIILDLGTSTSTTRTTGDRLTLLYLHFTKLYCIHCRTIISLTTRTRTLPPLPSPPPPSTHTPTPRQSPSHRRSAKFPLSLTLGMQTRVGFEEGDRGTC